MIQKRPIDVADLEQKVSLDDDIVAMVVFGSSVREHSYRDIDVCLFLYPEQDQKGIKTRKKLEYLEFMDAYDVSFFNDLPLYVKARVLKEGEILIDKDYDVLFQIYMRTIKDYELFKPHFETFLQAVKHG